MTLFTIHDVESEGDEIIAFEHADGSLLISVTEMDLPTELVDALTDQQELDLQTRTVKLGRPGVRCLAIHMQARLDETQAPRWWEDRDNISGLAYWLKENDRADASSLVELIGEPWKWSEEFKEYQAAAE